MTDERRSERAPELSDLSPADAAIAARIRDFGDTAVRPFDAVGIATLATAGAGAGLGRLRGSVRFWRGVGQVRLDLRLPPARRRAHDDRRRRGWVKGAGPVRDPRRRPRRRPSRASSPCVRLRASPHPRARLRPRSLPLAASRIPSTATCMSATSAGVRRGRSSPEERSRTTIRAGQPMVGSRSRGSRATIRHRLLTWT